MDCNEYEIGRQAKLNLLRHYLLAEIERFIRAAAETEPLDSGLTCVVPLEAWRMSGLGDGGAPNQRQIVFVTVGARQVHILPGPVDQITVLAHQEVRDAA